MGGGDGPISPVGPMPSLAGAQGAEQIEATDPAAQADAVEHATRAEELGHVGDAAALSNNSAIDQITTDFASGKLDRTQAIEALIEAVMPAHLGGVPRAEVKEIMLDLVASDPYLQQLVSRLDAAG